MHKYLVKISYVNAEYEDVIVTSFKCLYDAIRIIVRRARYFQSRVRIVVRDYETLEQVFFAYAIYSGISHRWIARIGDIGYFKGTGGIDF